MIRKVLLKLESLQEGNQIFISNKRNYTIEKETHKTPWRIFHGVFVLENAIQLSSLHQIFNKRALIATITVLRDINIAPTAGLRTIPNL